MDGKVSTVFMKKEKCGNVKKIRPATTWYDFPDVMLGFQTESCKQSKKLGDLE